MPIKDKEKAREYKRLWIAQKRSRQNNVEPQPVEPCSHCLKLEKKVKELELKIINLQETNQILRKDLGYWQEK